jgi:hypothetical protein
MYFVIALLSVIVILLVLLYKTISVFISFIKDEFNYIEKNNYPNVSLREWLGQTLNWIYEINKNIKHIIVSLNCDNPAGNNSAESKHKQALIKLYSEKLALKELLSAEEAHARASFEFSEFDNEKLIDKINGNNYSKPWDDKYQNRRTIEKCFLETGLLTKNCTNELQKLIPHDLCLPIWILFKKNSWYKNVENPLFKIAGHETSYNDYVKNRAIVLKLIDLGIIIKAIPKRKNATDYSGDFWLNSPCIKFQIIDFEEIKRIIYNGKAAHDDDHFEERYIASNRADFFKNYDSLG